MNLNCITYYLIFLVLKQICLLFIEQMRFVIFIEQTYTDTVRRDMHVAYLKT